MGRMEFDAVEARLPGPLRGPGKLVNQLMNLIRSQLAGFIISRPGYS